LAHVAGANSLISVILAAAHEHLRALCSKIRIVMVLFKLISGRKQA
jgi:hypothetical protein